MTGLEGMGLLHKIVETRRYRLEERRRAVPLSRLEETIKVAPPPRGFARKLETGPGMALIAEVKRASPSRGIFVQGDFSPCHLAMAYEGAGAEAVSVLTEEDFFLGHPDHVRSVKAAVSIPVLRKDFILEEYQLYESRALGADAVLLITALLDLGRLRGFLEVAAGLGLDPLVEVHTLEELERAVAAGATLIGINNRDLRTFHTDVGVSEELSRHVPPGCTLVSESGIRSREDVLRLAGCGVRAILVGEILVTSPDPAARIRELLGNVEPPARKAGPSTGGEGGWELR